MANEKRLTEQDKLAYYAIAGFIKDHGYPPSVRDLCRMTGKASTATIQYRLKSLEQKGYIKIAHGENRSIRITRPIDDDLPMTNADRIRAMSDEELAQMISQAVTTGACNDLGIPSKKPCDSNCKVCILEWLQQPVEDK